MPNRLLPFLLALLIVALAACGGDDDNKSSATPEGSESPGESLDASATAGPTADVSGPAEAIVIFGSPTAAREALAASHDLPDVKMILLPGASAGDGNFVAEDLPPGVNIRGAKLSSTPRDTGFSDRYSGTYETPDPQPAGFREAYDSVYLVALSAIAAGSTDPVAVRDQMHLVANSPGDLIDSGPDGWATATEILLAGGDINLIGASGLADITSGGESSKSSADVWSVINGAFVPLEHRDVDLAAEVDAENPIGQVATPPEAPDAALIIGGIVSLTGPLESTGGPLSNAMQLAVDEINAAGGVFGQDVQLNIQDDGSTPEGAIAAAQALVDAGASAIIGPSDGSTVQAVIEQFENPGVTVLSLATWGGLGALEDEGVMMSITAIETVEAPVLANLMRESELQVACVVYEDGLYGRAMSDTFTRALELKNGGVRASKPFVAGDDLTDLIRDCAGA